MARSSVKAELIRYAHSLGFEQVGITTVDPLSPDQDYFKTWLAQGYAGDMDYLEKESPRRSQPASILPEAKSVVALAMNYYVSGSSSRPGDGRVARYARGADYHKTINKLLKSFVRYLESLAPDARSRTFVDTGPLLERALARRAGLGFVGKNTMLITKGLGSWVFLAHVVTTLELPADRPDDRSCGDCRLCIDACPTQAIIAPFTLDARRCIAYLTIEKDGPIDEELRPKMGEWIFGCDVCQEVCPHNARPHASPVASLRSCLPAGRLSSDREGWGQAEFMLSDILAIRDEHDFRQRFAGTAFMRAGRSGLIRNACLAAANLGRKDLIPHLQELAEIDADPIVREQAAWSVKKLKAGHA